MWVATMGLHFKYMHEKVELEAAAHQQPFSESEFRTEWLSDTFENHQSEYAQLFFQSLFVVAMASVWFRKQQEELARIEAKLDQILDALASESRSSP
jgi:hypothetical protein